MIRRFRLLTIAILLLLGAGIWGRSRQETAAYFITVSGLVQVSDLLQLNISISPPVSQPGDWLQLNATLTNLDPATQSPEVIFQLPAGVSLAETFLPAGLTLNVQTNTLHWLPIITSGGMQSLSLPLRVETADIQTPDKTITAVLRLNGAEETITTTFWAGIPPQINSILSPPQVAAGQPFQLRAELGGSGPFGQTWDLGDGRTLKVNDPLVVFPAAGVYQVHLEASNPLATANATKQITVVPHPAAQFTLDDFTPSVGQEVSFISQSGGVGPLQFAWDFGDGAASNEANPRHVYNGLGTYQVHLKVWNDYGQSDAYWPVTVGQLPTADITIPPSIPAGQNFSGLAIGDASVLRYEWTMGDGRNLDGAQINHMYTQSGDYYITMIAVNEYGGTEVGRWLHVDPGVLSVYLPFISNGSGGVEAGTADLEDVLDGLDLPPIQLAQPFVLETLPISTDATPTEQLFLYINEARRQFNRQPLTNVVSLNAAAQSHAADMAAYGFTAHTGSDGSTPLERYIWQGYTGGYAGETTAWGFEQARQAAEYWINSPDHRRILLNEAATDVGVGYYLDYNAPNVWYWSAEFGNTFAAPDVPVLRVQEPANLTEAMLTTAVNYTWNWPTPLSGNQHFVLYLHTTQGAFPIAEVSQPQRGAQYAVQLSADNFRSGDNRLQVLPGRYEWQVKLEDGGVVAESERRSIAFLFDPNAPTPTATPTATLTPSPTATPTNTPTPTPEWPTPTPLPPTPTNPPPLVTATPNP